MLPGFEKPWVAAGRSKFHRKGVKPVADLKNFLVSGHCNSKIGRDVRKARFRGYWIYTLTLEERATCPSTCKHWQTCYGNNMPFAKRIDHRDREALEAAIERDIRRLISVRGRRGILIRLHALGDFFDPAYVRFWQTMLALHDRLAVYGYTAWHPGTQIGDAIATAKALYGNRFAIRYSDGGLPEDSTVSIPDASHRPPHAFVCPEQTGVTTCCATCGACWSTRKNVAFLDH